LSHQVTATAASVPGAGASEAVVMGNVALVAIQLNAAQPGGTQGAPLMGKAHAVDYPGSSPSGGPVYLHGPGGSVGASPAREGGQINPGGATPGGSPNSTQAITNGNGGLADQNGTHTTAAPHPGSVHSTPLDVMTRIADTIRTQHPSIVEVRFASTPDDARRAAALAAAVKGGTATGIHSSELRTLYSRATPAGTTEFTTPPTQGSHPTLP
jgi:hypothetical protein